MNVKIELLIVYLYSQVQVVFVFVDFPVVLFELHVKKNGCSKELNVINTRFVTCSHNMFY